MRILLIEDNPGDVRLLQYLLNETSGDFTINVVEKLEPGLRFLASQDTDVVLLDLNLPDSCGLETFTRLQTRFPNLPIVILTGSSDETLGIQAVQSGAQDYMVKGQVDGGVLRRALVYAIERKKADEALKEKEQFLERLAELNPAIIFVVDLTNNREIYSSKPWMTLLGYKPEEIKDVASFQESIFCPGDFKKIVTTLAELKKANDTRIRDIEVRVRDAGGRWRWLQIISVIFKRDRNGLPLQSMSIAREITERKEAEQIKDEFIGMVSHELRTPLTVVMGAVKVAMTEGITPEEIQELLKEAEQSAVSLGQILDNLIELSRYQSNRLKLATERLDIAQFIKSTLETERKRLQSHKFLLDIASDLPLVVVDKIRVQQVLRNLLDNSAKYSPAGSNILISARQENGCLRIGVRNWGKPIPKADQEKLFQPFQRLECTSSIKGLGLGLLVCRRLVEAHGGKIWCESETGQATTFYFTFPLPQ